MSLEFKADHGPKKSEKWVELRGPKITLEEINGEIRLTDSKGKTHTLADGEALLRISSADENKTEKKGSASKRESGRVFAPISKEELEQKISEAQEEVGT